MVYTVQLYITCTILVVWSDIDASITYKHIVLHGRSSILGIYVYNCTCMCCTRSFTYCAAPNSQYLLYICVHESIQRLYDYKIFLKVFKCRFVKIQLALLEGFHYKEENAFLLLSILLKVSKHLQSQKCICLMHNRWWRAIENNHYNVSECNWAPALHCNNASALMLHIKWRKMCVCVCVCVCVSAWMWSAVYGAKYSWGIISWWLPILPIPTFVLSLELTRNWCL